MSTNWYDHPTLQNMDPVKLELFKTVISQTNNKQGKDIANTLFSIIAGARKKNVSFTDTEIALIVEILKEGKSKEEQNHIDKMLHMVRSMIKTHSKK